MTRRILHVVTNVGRYEDESHPTGLWLSELTHAWHVFEEHGFEQTSPSCSDEEAADRVSADQPLDSESGA